MTTPPWSRTRPWLYPTATVVVLLMIVVVVAFAPSGRGGGSTPARTAAPPTAGAAAGSAAGAAGLIAPRGAPGADVNLRLIELFRRRAQAVLHGDSRAWRSTLDPRSPAFVRQQITLFERLRLLPLTAWSYSSLDSRPLEGGTGVDPNTRVIDVRLTYRLAADTRDVVRDQRLVARRFGGGWALAGAQIDPSQQRDLWDLGPIALARGRRSLVIGSSTHRAVLRRFAAETDAAARRVDAVWGTRWPRTVVVEIPADLTAMAWVLGSQDHRGLDQVAAITIGDLATAGGGPRAGSADRVVVNASAFSAFGPVGRRVVLTHEVTHVATRATSVVATPLWLQEGFADYVAYRDTGLSRGVIAADALRLVRAGRAPWHLPSAQDFDPSRSRIAPAYAEAWLAMDLIARTGGPREVVAFYRAAAGIDGVPGAGRPGQGAGGNAAGAPAVAAASPGMEVEAVTATAAPASPDEATTQAAFRGVLGTDQAGFERRWRSYLVAVARAP
jgi:hypothetical protein